MQAFGGASLTGKAAGHGWLCPAWATARAGRAIGAVGLLSLVGARPHTTTLSRSSSAVSACTTVASYLRPALYAIPLLPDQGMSGSGLATLVPAPSPFGITVTPDGHPIFDITVTVQNLAAPQANGGTQYVAWATTQDLTDADRIGVIGHDQKAVGKVAWNKYIVLVTSEGAAVGDHWKGTVVLRGFSPATYLTNYASHPLFLGGMPPC